MLKVEYFETIRIGFWKRLFHRLPETKVIHFKLSVSEEKLSQLMDNPLVIVIELSREGGKNVKAER